MEKIDIVIPWLDSSDENWIKSFNKCKYKELQSGEDLSLNMNNEARYRDYNTLKYWFRMVERNMEWVNKIYLVTANQVPKWLNTNNERIRVVFHEEFMHENHLPTFNSSAIMINLHKIRGLSENFILFNDDMFPINKCQREDFFINDFPCDSLTFSPIYPDTDGFSHMLLNNMRKINLKYNKKNIKNVYSRHYHWQDCIRNVFCAPYNFIPGFFDYHIALPFRKSDFEKGWEMFSEDLEKTSKHKFRTNDDLTEWLFRYIRLCENKFSAYNVRKLGKLIDLSNLDEVKEELGRNKYKILCINDTNNNINFENNISEVIELFEKNYSQKSDFEV